MRVLVVGATVGTGHWFGPRPSPQLRPGAGRGPIREGQGGRAALAIRSELADLLIEAAESNDYLRQAIAVGR